jgi:4-aminobutyrate aminotransferase/(S)-3-amino-2-methylpropionate transaminase
LKDCTNEFKKDTKIEFIKDGEKWEADPVTCGKVTKEALKNGLLLAGAGLHKNVIRLLVPLVITDEQLNEGLDVLDDRAIETVTKA